jgi:hypothetical protein
MSAHDTAAQPMLPRPLAELVAHLDVNTLRELERAMSIALYSPPTAEARRLSELGFLAARLENLSPARSGGKSCVASTVWSETRSSR